MKKPVRPEARYCTPSSSPATVEAVFVPPKSMEAVPVSMPCTPNIHIQTTPIMNEAMNGEAVAPSIYKEAICPR